MREEPKSLSDKKIHLEGLLGDLARFWSAEGCALVPSCEAEMPTTLLHPEIFFRLPGAEPTRLACLQGVYRPTDGRQGKHPFRLARYLQFAVFLKPPPGDVQQLFLRALSACGLDLDEHDIRFMEWNWSSHAMDGWGVGWRVEIDGLGVARITFLQRLAERELEPPTVEIVYGVERLLLALSGVRGVFRLPWNAGEMTYGALRQGEEVELSQEAYENADVTVLRQSLDALAGAAGQALAAGSPRLGLQRVACGLVQLELLEARRELSSGERRQRVDILRQRILDAVARQLGETPPSMPEVKPASMAEPSAEVDATVEGEKKEPAVTAKTSDQEVDRVAEVDGSTAEQAAPAAKPKAKAPRQRKPAAPRRRAAKGGKGKATKTAKPKKATKPARSTEDEDAD